MANQLPRRPVRKAERPWEALGSYDPKVVHKAMLALTDSPVATVKTLCVRLQPATEIDTKKLEECLKNLDDPLFQVRQNAKTEIESFGSDAKVILERFVKETASVEARERVEEILKQLLREVRDTEQVCQVRAMEVLERIGSTDAKQLVEKFSKGAADAALTRDAKAVLGRLRR